MTDSNEVEIVELMKRMIKEFEMSDLGVLSYFLGIEFPTTRKGIFTHQKKYATVVLKRFNMTNCNPTTTPAEMNSM